MAVYLAPHFCPESVFPPDSPRVSPAKCQDRSLSPSCIFTRTALPTIRTHYCQMCHLRLPERQKQLMGQLYANRAGAGVWILTESTMFI